MKTWAEHEVELACKKENPDWDGKSFDYGCACYQSALKAYKSLLEDEHSGMSFAFTKSILIRLMNRLPLTPITEDDFKDAPNSLSAKEDDITQQCPRMSSLFRTIDKDGNVSFNDVDRITCHNIGSKCDYSSGLVNAIINKMFPITLPYWPSEKNFKVYTEEFLIDPANGDFDTVGVFYCIKPDAIRVEINKFFTVRNDQMVEIPMKEYYSLKEKAVKPDQVRKPVVSSEITMQPE